MKKNSVWLILTVFFGITVGGILFSRVWAGGNLFSDLRPLIETYQAIQTQYIEKVKPSKLIEGAIKGMIESLEDPHSRWMDPRSYKEMETEKEGKFGGLGIQITIKDNFLTIVSPLEGTPASEAGIEPGDRIIKIEGKSTQGITLTEAMEKLRGEPGTGIKITIQREGEKNYLEFNLTRAIIKFPNIKQRVLPHNIGYIKIMGFTNENTDEDLKAALAQLEDKKIEGLILDLRYNPGGLLSQAVEVADEFLDSGVIVSTKGREGSQNRIYHARPGGEAVDIPLVVLVNGGSASASEIVAGAIKDHNRGILIGTKSFGKGTVQSIIPLVNEGAITLTTARYYTPSRESIEGKGIEPYIKVEAFKPTEEEKKALAQLEKSEWVKEFLAKYPHWEEMDLAFLLQGLKKEGIEVEADLLEMFLREEDEDRENDYLNDLQLLQALEILSK
ncbi:MAG: S41 family peptidase [bacterium]